MGLREELFAIDTLKPTECYVPYWNRKVLVRPLTGEEFEKFQSLLSKETGWRGTTLAWLACRVVVDDQGNRAFTDEDAKQLAKVNGKALEAIFAHVLAETGLDGSAEKNSETPTSGSGS